MNFTEYNFQIEKNKMITPALSQNKSKKNSGITNRLIYFFIFILLISVAGFYKTYLVKFPSFEGFTWVQHFHGAVMLTWVLMLIAQPVFIRTKTPITQNRWQSFLLYSSIIGSIIFSRCQGRLF